MVRVLVVASALDAAGPVAREIARLWWLMLILGVAVFLVFAVVLGWGLVRPRGSPADQPPPAQPRAGWRMIVAAGVVMPVIVLIVIFGYTVDVMRAVPARGAADALVVEVVGHQWWWEIRYPAQGVTTANELHLPVGRQIELRLRSADVIHSLWVPELAGKIDLLPEDENTLVLEADEPGVYRGRCAEFCGLQHAKMRFLAIAEPAEDFEAWLAGQRKPAAEPTDTLARRGRRVFLSSGCASCHTIAGTAARGMKGPDLTHVAMRRTIAAGTLANTRANLAAWIDDPQAIKPGTQMPDVNLTGPEREALLRYLQTLR